MNLWEDAEVISTYTRAQALEDGFLVDVSQWASDGPEGMRPGFKAPVAMTRSIWQMIESIPDSMSCQDLRGRAHDVLWMALLACRAAGGGDTARFRVILPVRGQRRRVHTFKAVIHGGDSGAPVVTIMLPEED